MLAQSFEGFIEKLEIDEMEDILNRFKKITKRLNKSFWDSEDDEEHGIIVGSLGRNTAIKGISDLDMLFVLPKEVKDQYDQHEGNGQSKLLQAVKEEIKKTYPRTVVRGDGQVVVVSFESINYTIEVCPAFERIDGAYDYPDSKNGGSWKKTDPIPEIDESIQAAKETNNNFKYLCNIIRAWKNHIGFKFGGLLIDTLVYKFLDEYEEHKEATFFDYLQVLKDLFYYLKTRNKDQKYWYALGSNQKVYNKNGTFVSKANSAYNKIKDLTEESDNLYEVLQELFGKNFPVPETVQVNNIAKSLSHSVRQTEEFIENLFPIDIKYSLRIDCEVTQNGFRNYLLRYMLKERIPLLPNKSLRFFIAENELDDISKKSEEKLSYQVYWKVLNRGEEAIRRDCIRGQIVRDKGKHEKIESTNFKGGHYVECYIVHNSTVVAKDHIDVPIVANQS